MFLTILDNLSIKSQKYFYINGQHLILCIITILMLSGCAAAGTAAAVANVAMKVAGIEKKPEVPDAEKPPLNVNIALQASNELNTDEHGKPLALVTKIYKLRQKGAFNNATYNTFLSAEEEKAVLGADLLEVKEVVLIPGQLYEVDEKITREAYHVGVVALFRSPYGQHWRTTFAPVDVEKDGVKVHFYSCGLALATAEKKLQALNAMISQVNCNK